jgi:hypothetical protein
MNQKKICAIGLSLFLLIITACTDVPLSFSTKLTDPRVIGFWQDSHNTIVEIRKSDGGIANMIPYEFNEETKAYQPADDPALLYFTSITENGDTFQFISMESECESGKCYFSTKFSISTTGTLLLEGISAEFLEKTNKASKNGTAIFGSAERYREFIKNNMHDPELFDAGETYQRLQGLPKG